MVAASVVDVHTFLDNRPIGRQQWAVMVLGVLVLVLDGFDTTMMGFIAPALVQDWGVPRQALGPLMMSGLLGLSIGSLLAGPLADRVGRRRVIILAVAFFGTWCLACAFAPNLFWLTGARFLTGVGLGAVMPNITTLLAECAPARRRSALVTSAWCGFAAGGALGGLASEHLIRAFGWPSVFVAGGVLPLLLLLPLHAWLAESLRYRMAARHPHAAIAKAVNALVPGAADEHTRFINSEPLAVGQPAGAKGLAVLLNKPLRRGTLMIWVAMFMGFLNLYLLSNWLPITAREAGLSLSQAAVLGAMLQLGGVFGDFTVGMKMDRWDKNQVISLMLAGSAGMALLIAASDSAVLVLNLLVLLLGYFMMSANAGCFALAAAYYPTDVRATGVSWVFGIGRTGAILGAGGGAVMMGLNWSMGEIFVFLSLPSLLAIVALQVKRAADARQSAC